MDELKDLFLLLLALASIAIFFLAYLKLLSMLDQWMQRRYGIPLRRRSAKIEIQTLFHGNTKDQDQI